LSFNPFLYFIFLQIKNMIWFFTPYSFEKKLFEAYNRYMKLIPKPNDWGCLMDGDMAFLMSDFGAQIQEYIDKYPETGMFISYASRSPYMYQVPPDVNHNSDSIRYVFENTLKMREGNHLKVIEQNRLSCGPILLIKKATWDKYASEIEEYAQCSNIQAVDTAISAVLTKHGEKTLLMAGMQVYHYYRQYSFTEKHILSDKLTVVIRTHDRPEMFKRAIESVRNQTHKNIDIVVGVDTADSMKYAKQFKPTKIIECTPRERKGHQDFPANEYISNLIQHITEGYILILDDDNYIADPEGVEKLFSQIDKELCVYIIRYRYPDGQLFPNNQLFNSKTIQNGGIDWASCVFHARLRDVAKTKPLYNADFHFITSLVDYIKVTKWIDLALVHTETPGNDGKTELQMANPGSISCKPPAVCDVVMLSNAKTPELKSMTEQAVKTLLASQRRGVFNVTVIEQTKQKFEGTTTIRMPGEFHFNRFANEGIKTGAAPWVCVANNDLVFHKGWMAELMKIKADVMSPVDPANKRQANIRKTESGFVNGRHFSGWCFVMRRSVWERIGGLDEDFSFWGADTSTIEQLKAIGIIPIVVHASKVTHERSTTLKTLDEKTRKSITWNQYEKFFEKFNKNELTLHK
jgi:hypothetical protein